MKRLNIGVLAHVDGGKTTLVERLLFEAGVIRQMGKIEAGDTMMDSLELEQDRGISIKNSYTSFMSQDCQINLIDTPGHYDFVDEVETVLDVLDGVILVVSGIDGVQSQTKKFWNKLQAAKIPTILFVNKADYPYFEEEAIFRQLSQQLSPAIVAIKARDNALFFTEEGQYTLVEGQERLEEKWLEGELTATEASDQFLLQFNASQIYPVITGSAKKGQGIELLFHLIKLIEEPSQEPVLAGVIYKIIYDEKLGKGCYLRLFGGELAIRDSVQLNRKETSPTKIRQLRQRINGKSKDVTKGVQGDIVIVYGLTEGVVGDTIGQHQPLDISKTPALFFLTIAEMTGKNKELQRSVFELSEEYPGMSYELFEETNEIQLKVMGKMQGEIIYYELTNRYGLRITMGTPRIIYQETPSKVAIGYERYTMPKPSWAVVKLLIEPAPRGSGYHFINEVNNDDLLPRYHSQIATSLLDSLKIGRFGWQVTDLIVTLVEGESHREHTHPLDFSLASPIALQAGLASADMLLLEPMMLLKAWTSVENLSKVVADVINMEGQIVKEVYHESGGYFEGLVPLATSLDYSQSFFKQTQGEGLLEQEFDSYQVCPPERYRVQSRKGIDPLDREKWILHRRGAISS